MSEKGSCGGEYVCGGEYPGEMSYIFKAYGHWTLDSRASAWFCLDAPLAQEAAVVHLVCWSFCFSAKPSRAEIWQDRRVSVSSR